VIPASGNGGFPLPAPGGPQRVVEAMHGGCSKSTRVSLPAVLPLRTVRRVVCEHCENLFDASEVVEVRQGLGRRLRAAMSAIPAMPALPAASAPSLSVPSRFDLRWLTLPIAALAVFAILSLLNGDESAAPDPASTATAAKPETAVSGAKADAKAANGKGASKTAVPADARLVAESTFSLALPAGWDRVNPATGATFAAISPDGAADATLWIQRDPKLDFASFEATSLQQLETLAGSSRVVKRNVGPTVESSSITLAPKNVPSGAPTYEVVLRGSGDNWYYLATTHQASAPAEAIAGVDLIQGSFLPIGGKG